MGLSCSGRRPSVGSRRLPRDWFHQPATIPTCYYACCGVSDRGNSGVRNPRNNRNVPKERNDGVPNSSPHVMGHQTGRLAGDFATAQNLSVDPLSQWRQRPSKPYSDLLCVRSQWREFGHCRRRIGAADCRHRTPMHRRAQDLAEFRGVTGWRRRRDGNRGAAAVAR